MFLNSLCCTEIIWGIKAGDEILTNCFKKRVDPKCVLKTSISFIVICFPPRALLYNQLPMWTSDTLNCVYLCLLLKWAHKYFLNLRVLKDPGELLYIPDSHLSRLLFSKETSDWSILAKKSLYYQGLRVFFLCSYPLVEWALSDPSLLLLLV